MSSVNDLSQRIHVALDCAFRATDLCSLPLPNGRLIMEQDCPTTPYHTSMPTVKRLYALAYYKVLFT